MSAPLTRTDRTAVRRLPKRGSYDRGVLNAILDEGLVCHVGFVASGQPYVIPTTYGRVGEQLYVHGSAASRMLKTMTGGIPVCVTVTLLDGLVLARSAFHHSMNYRSAMVLGTAQEVVDDDERWAALRAIVDHVVPGRWDSVRPPSEVEMRATLVLRLAIDEASAKIRTGPPVDDDEDYTLPYWAGVLPMRTALLPAVADPRLAPGIPVPAHVSGYRRPGGAGLE
jgi:nitroimidazol reductase NimA-like FMN-containing flavoprotein (pyridoxamine 5'-phosphate oxidase superfamily)